MSFERKLSCAALAIAALILLLCLDFLRRGNLPMALSSAGGALYAAIVGGWPRYFSKLFRMSASQGLRESQLLPLPIGVGIYLALALAIGGQVWSWLSK